MFATVELIPMSPLVEAFAEKPNFRWSPPSATPPTWEDLFHVVSKRLSVMSVGGVAPVGSNNFWPLVVNVASRGTVLVGVAADTGADGATTTAAIVERSTITQANAANAGPRAPMNEVPRAVP